MPKEVCEIIKLIGGYYLKIADDEEELHYLNVKSIIGLETYTFCNNKWTRISLAGQRNISFAIPIDKIIKKLKEFGDYEL